MKKWLLYLALMTAILAACKKDDVDPQNNFTYLVESKFLATVSKDQILLTASMYPEIYSIVSNLELADVGVFKIKYKTVDAEENEIIASGAVLVPIIDEPLPLISYQHGTMVNQSDAPSKYSTGLETRALATILASAGYAISVPDYLGYGESADYPHPYEHSKTLASASFDMLMAAKEHFADNDIIINGKLFLTGYSEGGNATMALQRYIETHSDLNITMSAPASGAYNKTAFAKAILQTNEDLQFLPNYMWVFYSYNWIYNLDRQWNYYTIEPNATALESVTDPMNLYDAEIDNNPQLLFTTKFIDGVLNGTDTDFLNVLAENDNFDWSPKYPITLYYGTDDDYVFPLNSETAYDALYANGAMITKVAIEGADHEDAFVPYVLGMFELFESLK